MASLLPALNADESQLPLYATTVIPMAALIALLAIPAGANAYTLGVSDQQA